MCQLIRSCFEEVHIDIVTNWKEKLVQLTDHLSQHWPILIPYDADFNHEPCCRRGKSAHWAVLVGFLLENIDDISGESKGILSLERKLTPEEKEQINERTLYFFAKQGKSPRLMLWNAGKLIESNINLSTPAPKTWDGNFCLPSKNIERCLEESLANQIILLRPRDAK